MEKPSDSQPDWGRLREQIIGLGERSIRKSYYPQLRRKLEELEHFRDLLDCSNDLILSCEFPGGRILDANGSFWRALDLRPAEAKQLTLREICPHLADRLAQGGAGGDAATALTAGPLVTEFRTCSGKTLPVEVTCSFRRLRGSVLGILVARGIAERLQAERALKESEARHRLVVENADAAIFVLQDGFARFANGRTRSLFGLAEESLRTVPFWDWVHPEERERTRRLVGSESPRLDQTLQHILRRLGNNGEVRWFELDQMGVIWDGQPAILHFAQDITERKLLEERLRQSQKMEAIGTLSGGIAHDFNNILSIIIGNLELALAPALAADFCRERLQEVHTAALRARDLVQQLLSFTRKRDILRKALRPTEAVAEAVRLLRASLPAEIAIEVKAETNLGTILADPTQFQQILLNLASNAGHAMAGRGGRLTLALAELHYPEGGMDEFPQLAPGRYLRLTVTDTGRGIAAGDLERIFDPYFTTKAPGQGTGMGLAVVHGIVDAHGGAIRVASTPDEGTRFDLVLPMTDEVPVSVSEPALVAARGSGRILFVDDEPALVDLAENALTLLGYQVTAVTHPEEALRRFEQDPDGFDLVITDLSMPGLSGDRLAERMHAVRSDLPIFLCTGYLALKETGAWRQPEVQRCLQKPLRIAELAEAVRSALGEGKGARDEGRETMAGKDRGRLSVY